MRSATVQLLSPDTCENCDSTAVVTKFEGLNFENARMREGRLQNQPRQSVDEKKKR